MTCLAAPSERTTGMTTAQVAARAGWHVDTIRKRSSAAYSGPGHRLHRHHTTGTRGGELVFREAVVDAWLAGATYLEQLRRCGPNCPELRRPRR